jgi:hypothetical protein
MKIAIPTNDGLTVASQLSPVKGFLVMTIYLGEIMNQEMRWINANGNVADEEKILSYLADCDRVLVREITGRQKEILLSDSREIIPTGETIITKAILSFLDLSLRKETNSCCCP